MSGTNSKLSLKGDRDVKLTFQRQVPTFLKQYSHLLGSKRPDPRQEDEPQYDRGEFKAVEDGAQVVCSAISDRDSEAAADGDDDFAKIRALYESEWPKQDKKTITVVKCQTESKEETEEIFDPSKKVVFKRKLAPSRSISAPSPVVETGESATSCGDTVAVEKNKKPKTFAKNLLSFNHDE